MRQRYRQLGTAALLLFCAGVEFQYASAQATNAPAASAPSAELVSNGGFENGMAGWGTFIPAESEDKNCKFDVVGDNPHSGNNCARLTSDDYARFSVGAESVPVSAGEHYRISVWVRADPAAQVRMETHGVAPTAAVVIRVNLRQGNADAPGGHLFLGLNGKVARGTPAPWNLNDALPQQWTKIEGVIEIPAGVDTILPAVFVWWAKGAIFLDDLSVQKVDASTPATPLTFNTPPPSSAPPAATAEVIPATGPVTSDADLLAALNLDTPGLEKVKAAAPAGGSVNWAALEAAYLDYRRTASPARWHFSPQDKPPPSEKDDALGDEVVNHHIRNNYSMSPAGADMGADFNWTFNPVARGDPSFSDEWTFCVVSRTEFWQSLSNAYWKTGDEKYAAAWVDQLRDFARKNPMHYDPVPGQPSLWRTLDAAERISISWPNAYFTFLPSPSFTPDANWLYLKLNYEHAQLLLHGLSFPGRTGNWVATECGALYTIGTLFPEFRDAATWRQTALDRISQELDKAVPPDGFEAELTPTYHYVALTGYRQPLEMARLNHLTVPDNFRDRILGMYRAPVLVMDQSGHAVPTNDSEILDVAHKAREGLLLGDDPLLEWAASRGKEGTAPPDSDALPYAGFYAMRGGWKRDDTFLFFRAGPTGIGHSHESDLEVVLRAWNKTLLFEPGTYAYDQSEWRRFTINTPSHSTIIVDNKWQHAGSNVPPVPATGNPWVTTPLFDYVAGTYRAGYQTNIYKARPFAPQVWKGTPDKSVTHTRRVLFLRPGYALVLDTLDGTGNHTFDALFQVDSPAAKLDPTTHAAFSQNESGAQLALYPLETENLAADIVQGQEKPSLLGWMPRQHRATPTVRFRKQQAAPAVFATFLYPYLDQPPDFQATPLAVTGDNIWSRSLQTSQEKIDLALATTGTATSLAFHSPLAGDVTAQAEGLVIRQPLGATVANVGGWNLSAYSDAKMELTAASPASLVIAPQANHLLLYNAGDQSVALTIKRPFAKSLTLASKAWTSVDASSVATDIPAPVLVKPLESASSQLTYDNYLKDPPGPVANAAASAIHVGADHLTLPAAAILTTKRGSDGPALCRWDAAGTVASTCVTVPQAGWYHLKMRYCSGDEALRTLLVNGKAPFEESESFSIPSTIGGVPSDGWSNLNDDWHEIVLGAEQVADGWKFYLPQGPCQLALRNDGGGLNINWLELDPAK